MAGFGLALDFPMYKSDGKLSCTWNTIALITSQIESTRAQCDLHIDSGLEINRENFVIAAPLCSDVGCREKR